MAGLEIPAFALATVPILLSGIDHKRGIARIGGVFWNIDEECQKRLRNAAYHERMYHGNLKKLLIPLVNDANALERLINDPGGDGWQIKSIKKVLEDRLQESYSLYMETVHEINKKRLKLEKRLLSGIASMQQKSERQEIQPQKHHSATKSSVTAFLTTEARHWRSRAKFSLKISATDALLYSLQEYNKRLDELLGCSDTEAALEKKHWPIDINTPDLKKVFTKTCEESISLYETLRKTCQGSYHSADLRLEHRTGTDMSFEVFLRPEETTSHNSQDGRELLHSPSIGLTTRRKPMIPATFSKSAPIQTKSSHTPSRVSRLWKSRPGKATVMGSDMEFTATKRSEPLCKREGEEHFCDCVATFGHGEEKYHLRPFQKRAKLGDGNQEITLDGVLSTAFDDRFSRVQRFELAWLLASSTAQLLGSPWLCGKWAKKDVIFFLLENGNRPDFSGPFLRRHFDHEGLLPSISDTISSLGVVLLELCSGHGLEDHPRRTKYAPGDKGEEEAFDHCVIMKWAKEVAGEAGPRYAGVVDWCLSRDPRESQFWSSEIIDMVVRPLGQCLQHLKADSGV